MNRRWTTWAAALLSLTLVACGSDSGSPPPADGGSDGAAADDAAIDGAPDALDGAAPDAGDCKSFQTSCGGGCVDLTSDPNDCGSCGHVCATGPHATPQCTNSACSVVCDPGWADCDRNAADGCEAALDDDPENCGSCGQVCPPLPSAFPACSNGTCGIGSCLKGYADCNGVAADGCEVDTGSDPQNCGSCGNACPNNTTCSGGACMCAGGGTSCNGACVDTSTDPNDCGSCGNVCPSSSTCSGGACSCPAYAPTRCGSSCVDTQSDYYDCGACGHVCGTSQTCTNGTCSCYGGYTLCNGACIYTYDDPKNCGGCGLACATGQVCNGGKCACPSSTQTLCSSGCVDLQNDPNNCGTCGNVCSGTSSGCTAGACAVPAVVLASSQNTPNAIVLDDTYVYWVDASYSGTVMRVAKAGGPVTTLVQGLQSPYGLAVDANGVYFTTPQSSQIEKVPLIGGTPTVLATQAAYGLALSGGTLFVGAGDVEALPTSGGSLTLLATGQNEPRALAVDAKNVYWITTSGVVASVPIAGGSVTQLTYNQSGNQGIAVDASNVYVTNSTAGTIVSVPIGGGGFTTLASGQSSPTGIAVAGGYVYWADDNSDGSVMKMPVGGGTPTALATGQNYPWGVAVDGTDVYWTSSGGYYGNAGSVQKTAR